MRDGHNGYAPSVGILPAREAVAAECAPARHADRRRPRRHHVRHVRRHRADADARSPRRATRCCPGADVSALHRGAREDRRAPGLLRHRRPNAHGSRTSSTSAALDRTRARARSSSSIRTTRPARRIRPTPGARCCEIADEHNIPLLADEVYADLAYDGPVAAIAQLDPDAPVISFSSLSKAYLAPGWRSGWLAVGRSDRLDDVLGAIKKLADGRLCSTGPMEYAIVAALTGDRSHQQAFRAALARTRGAHRRAAQRHRRHDCRSCRRGGVLRDAEGRAAAGRDRRGLRARRCCARRACSASTARASAPIRGRLLPRRVPRLAGGARPRSTISIADFTGEIPVRAADAGRDPTVCHVEHVDPDFAGPRELQAADPLRHLHDGAHRRSLLWAAYLVRNVLLLIYISGLFAIGFSPIVRLIERQKLLPVGSRASRAGSRSSSCTS